MACGKVTAKFTSKRQSVKQFPAFTAIAVVGSVFAPEPRVPNSRTRSSHGGSRSARRRWGRSASRISEIKVTLSSLFAAASNYAHEPYACIGKRPRCARVLVSVISLPSVRGISDVASLFRYARAHFLVRVYVASRCAPRQKFTRKLLSPTL